MPNTAPDPSPQELHIAVGVIRDDEDRILISQRRPGTPGAGLWEFPGGKCEPGESIQEALCRELEEELGVSVQTAQPLITIRHRYPDRSVLLDTWEVTGWSGEPSGLEGQTLAWVPSGELPDWPLLPANRPLMNAVRLPRRYLITPTLQTDRDAFLRSLHRSLTTGIRLVRLRQPTLNDADYASLATDCLSVCRAAQAQLLLDRGGEIWSRIGADGLHLSAKGLREHGQRPAIEGWLAASCHNPEELDHAAAIGCDFAVLGPMLPTPSHPQAEPLHWQQAGGWIDRAQLPVFAIGGMQEVHVQPVCELGGQGIAAIRAFWED